MALLGETPVVAGAGRGNFRGRPRRQSAGAERRARACTIGAMKRFAGIFTPIVTPFRSDDTLDEAGLRRNVTQLDEHVADRPGRARLERRGGAARRRRGRSGRRSGAARTCRADRPLIAGTGRESTRATIAATQRAAAAGVDAVLVRTPSFFKSQMTSDVFVRHYTDVADASPVPVLLYNVTMFTGVNLQPDAVERLAAHPNIVGMKESGSDIAQIARVRRAHARRLHRARRLGDDVRSRAVRRLRRGDPRAGGARAGRVRRAADARAREPIRRGAHSAAAASCRWRNRSAEHIGVAGLKGGVTLTRVSQADLPRPPLRPAAPATIDIIRGQLDALGVLRESARLTALPADQSASALR